MTARKATRLGWAVLGLALVGPLAALAVFNIWPDLDLLLDYPTFHFWVVSLTALAAGVASALVIASARTLRETRLLFLALSFVSIAGIFAVHGLMTPGFLTHELYATVPVSAWVSVFVGACFVALSAAELPHHVERFVERAGGAIFAWTFVLTTAYIVVSLSADEWLEGLPTGNRPEQYAVAFSAMALFGFGAWRYAQAYLFARLPSQAAIVCALVMLSEVPAILLWGDAWHASWWSYHALYGLAFVVLFAGWAVEVRRAGTLRAIADALSMRDALAQLNRGRDARVLSLVDAIEAKDEATLGHVSRVSAHALTIGRRLGLHAIDLRSLVLAAQMHDVGKIAVPDAVLRKPSALTEAEYEEVKRHTHRGDEIARRVDALRGLAPVIRAHHERMNGQGYPDGLAGHEIPLLARIIAVADTYDAMTSDRPYRSARSHDEALAELRRVSGSELDPRCVEALLASFQEEQLAA
jgi:HD-GYP domain-containing protein (c-di-GMP phosphodiesterase class II)